MKNPELSIIPNVLWDSTELFYWDIAPFQLKLMQTTTADLDRQISNMNLQYLKTRDKMTTWLAIAFSHPQLEDAVLIQLFGTLCINSRQKILLAALFGRLSLFEKIIENDSNKYRFVMSSRNYSVVAHIVSSGHLDLFAKLIELDPEQVRIAISTRPDAFFVAARYGHLGIMKTIDEFAPEILLNIFSSRYFSANYQVYSEAVIGGHLNILEWLIGKLTLVDPDLLFDLLISRNNRSFAYAPFVHAAKEGNLDIIEKLVQLYPEYLSLEFMIESSSYSAFRNAAAKGHTATVVWLVDKLAQLAPEIIPTMIAASDPEQGSKAHGYSAFCEAAKGGHLDVIVKLIELAPDQALDMLKVCEFKAFRVAAAGGHLAVMEWLITKLLELESEQVFNMINSSDFYAFRRAAAGGYLIVIERLIQLAPKQLLAMVKAGGTYDREVVYYEAFLNAVKGGHLAVIEKLTKLTPELILEMICYEDYLAFSLAAQEGHTDILDWLIKKITDLAPDQVSSMIADNCIYGDHTSFCLAVRGGHLQFLEKLAKIAPKYLLLMIKKNNYEAFSGAINREQPRVIEYLITKLAELDPAQVTAMITVDNDAALAYAAKDGNLALIEKLIEYAPRQVRAMIASGDCKSFHNAVSGDHPEVVKYFIEKMSECSPEKVPAMISSRNYDAFNNAAQNGAMEITEHFLHYSEIFAYAESHDQEYGVKFIYSFVHEQMIALREERTAFELANPRSVFNINNLEQSVRCFYFLRNMIRRNDSTLMDDFLFLMEIPSIKVLLHTSVTPHQENELLRLAIRIGNQSAAELLLTVPAVRELAVEDDFYADEARGGLDLAVLARDRESSITGLTFGEQKRLARAIERYQPLVDELGVDKIILELKALLKSRYEAHPAQIKTGDGRAIDLPFSWDEWNKTSQQYNADTREHALKAYYQHKDHTAWRYFAKPNPWMAENATYVNRYERGGWSTFEEYQPLIAMLFLAAKDEGIEPCDGYTLETRVDHFIDELKYINRAHNWDKTRTSIVDRKEIQEEYDDLVGDKPSCFSGVKRRLFQSVQGHPLLKLLRMDDIKQELREFTRGHFEQCIINHPDKFHTWQKNWEDLCETGCGAEALSVMDITQKSQDEFMQSLSKKYAQQFDEEPSFKWYIKQQFTLNAQIPSHAARFGGETDLSGLFKLHAAKNPSNKEELREARLKSSAYSMFIKSNSTKPNSLKDHKSDGIKPS